MKMIIGGQYTDASDGGVSQVVNPATGAVVDTVPEATLDDLDRAIALAVEGQKQWNAVPLHERLRILEDYCRLILDHTEEIARVMCEEGGKPLAQARTEVSANAAIFRIYCAAAYTFYGKTPYSEEEEFCPGIFQLPNASAAAVAKAHMRKAGAHMSAQLTANRSIRAAKAQLAKLSPRTVSAKAMKLHKRAL